LLAQAPWAGEVYLRVFNFQAYSRAFKEETTYEEACQLIREAAPRDYALHGESIERNLRRAKTPKFKHRYTMDDFLRGPLPLPAGKSLFLHGPSRVGKSHFALAHFKNPLLVSDMDDLKSFNPASHDGLVFDDMSFLHIPPEKVIHLVDRELSRSIRCRHTNALIPAGTPKIFTHNSKNPFYGTEGPMAATPEQQVAIAGRLDCYNVPASLIQGAHLSQLLRYKLVDDGVPLRPLLRREQERIYVDEGYV